MANNRNFNHNKPRRYNNQKNNKPSITKITSPYNFVPLNEHIFYPKWSNIFKLNETTKKQEHIFPVFDIPFKDGVSGEIEISIEAKSPIFVRDSQDEEKFCNFNGQYYIPGSSIKGLIRTISEIIGFAKFNTQDKKFSYRDLNNPSYKENAMNKDKIYMGWLYKKDDDWCIDSLGSVTKSKCRIKYEHLKQHLDPQIVHQIKKQKDAYKKYALIDSFDELNINSGHIVFTGSVGKEKSREFLFPHEIEDSFTLDKQIIENFKEAYYIGTLHESLDWKELWKDRFKKGHKIPVFFQIKGDKIAHFGLSMLYKLPYKNSTMDLVKRYVKNYDENKIDLAEAVFGYVKKDSALKSRVSFSHFKAIEVKKYNKKVSLPLSTPRSTFYPNYLVQCGDTKTREFKTYDDKNSILRGHKFYIPKNKPINEVETKNKKILTSFYPLDTNTIFKGKLKYFNLLHEELGLVLLALSILQDEHFYKIGMGKPYGFGDCHVRIENFANKDKYIEKFIKLINDELNIDLLNHPRIKALKELSKRRMNDDDLNYMELQGFTDSKRPSNKYILSEVVDNSYNKDNLCSTTHKNQRHKDNKKKQNNTKKDSTDLMNYFNNR